MQFSEQLSQSTKDSHFNVDKHNFVKLIQIDDYAGDLYINLNKLCISIIQKTIRDNNDDQYKNFNILFEKLYRELDIFDLYITPNINRLINRCKEYPIEHAYMFYIGLLFGGSLLSKKLPKHAEFLKFEDKSSLIKEFREYLNVNITYRDQFIKVVNESYDVIKNIFDEFENKFKIIDSGKLYKKCEVN
jgi:hypothetical protein